jgi:hypothetical protein
LVAGPYSAKVSRPTNPSSQVVSATGIKLGPILVGEVVPSSVRKCPMVSRPAGDLFSLLMKKDPHHRRERNFCPAGDPFPTGQVLTALRASPEAKDPAIWQGTDSPASTAISCRSTTPTPSYRRFRRARSPSFHGRVNNSVSFLRPGSARASPRPRSPASPDSRLDTLRGQVLEVLAECRSHESSCQDPATHPSR